MHHSGLIRRKSFPRLPHMGQDFLRGCLSSRAVV